MGYIIIVFSHIALKDKNIVVSDSKNDYNIKIEFNKLSKKSLLILGKPTNKRVYCITVNNKFVVSSNVVDFILNNINYEYELHERLSVREYDFGDLNKYIITGKNKGQSKEIDILEKLKNTLKI